MHAVWSPKPGVYQSGWFDSRNNSFDTICDYSYHFVHASSYYNMAQLALSIHGVGHEPYNLIVLSPAAPYEEECMRRCNTLPQKYYGWEVSFAGHTLRSICTHPSDSTSPVEKMYGHLEKIFNNNLQKYIGNNLKDYFPFKFHPKSRTLEVVLDNSDTQKLPFNATNYRQTPLIPHEVLGAVFKLSLDEVFAECKGGKKFKKYDEDFDFSKLVYKLRGRREMLV